LEHLPVQKKERKMLFVIYHSSHSEKKFWHKPSVIGGWSENKQKTFTNILSTIDIFHEDKSLEVTMDGW
jgi:hypothetical protein